MPVKCSLILEAMENLAPRRFAEHWDAVGLQVGSPEKETDCVLITLDVSEKTVSEAIAQQAGLIITHHPVIFKPIAGIWTNLPQGRLLQALLQHDIAVFSAHTNLDIAPGGVNDVLAQALQLKQTQVLSESFKEPLIKLVVYVPETHVEQVRVAISEAGGGHIGNYSHCTFQTSGIGTFLPMAGTSPYIGEQGKLAYTPEIRLETILTEPLIKQVVNAMLAVHPYEEVAYDLYKLQNQQGNYGLGRYGVLSRPACLQDFAQHVKECLHTDTVRVVGDLKRFVSRIAVCGGSGAGLISEAVKAGCDVLVTGDVKYHDAQEAAALGLAVVDAGHFSTEWPVVASLAQSLQNYAERNSWNLRIATSNTEQDIFQWI